MVGLVPFFEVHQNFRASERARVGAPEVGSPDNTISTIVLLYYYSITIILL